MKLSGEEEPALSPPPPPVREHQETRRNFELMQISATHLRVEPIDQNMGDGVFAIKEPNIRGG